MYCPRCTHATPLVSTDASILSLYLAICVGFICSCFHLSGLIKVCGHGPLGRPFTTVSCVLKAHFFLVGASSASCSGSWTWRQNACCQGTAVAFVLWIVRLLKRKPKCTGEDIQESAYPVVWVQMPHTQVKAGGSIVDLSEILCLSKQGWEDPWSSLVSKSSIISQPQASERPCAKKEGRGGKKKRVWYWTLASTCTLTSRAHTEAHANINKHILPLPTHP